MRTRACQRELSIRKIHPRFQMTIPERTCSHRDIKIECIVLYQVREMGGDERGVPIYPPVRPAARGRIRLARKASIVRLKIENPPSQWPPGGGKN